MKPENDHTPGRPFFSIVTITFNNLDGLRETAESVAVQTCRDFEWIVMDGGSTDGSREFLQSLTPQPDYWVSQKDGGIYDALNLGIAKAGGAYVICMNAGDVFRDPMSLQKVLEAKPTADVVYGDWVQKHRGYEAFAKAPSELPPFFFFMPECNICHQAMFVRTRLLQESKFDTSYLIYADWAKWRDFMLAGRSFQYVPVTVCTWEASEGASGRPEYIAIDSQHLRDAYPVGIILQGERLREYIAAKDAKINELIHSRSYRITRPLRLAAKTLRRHPRLVAVLAFFRRAYREFLQRKRARRNAEHLRNVILSWKFGPAVDFPADAVEVTRELSAPVPSGRTAIFAVFSKDGRLKDSTLYYLSHLGDVADNVIVVGDCPILPDELSRLPDVVRYCSFSRHGGYDFGSYKRGFEHVLSNPVLKASDELLFCNDSCYGPVTPFRAVFEKMADVRCDFWGLSESQSYQRHIQSYFLLFRKNVWQSRTFASFMRGIRKEPTLGSVIFKYEIGLTHLLEKNGFVGKSAALLDEQIRHMFSDRMNPTSYPISLMNAGCPLVKAKAFCLADANLEGVHKTLSAIQSRNAELGQILRKEIGL